MINQAKIIHWCINSIYNGFAKAIDCTFKVVPFVFCSVQVLPLFRIFFWLLRRSDEKLACSNFGFFGILAYLRLIYIPHSHQALKLQSIIIIIIIIFFSRPCSVSSYRRTPGRNFP